MTTIGTRIKLLIFLTISLLLNSLFAEISQSSTLKEYEIEYEAKFNGLDVTASYELSRINENVYQEKTSIKHLLGEINEKAEFSVFRESQIRPHSYIMKRALFGSKRQESIDFLWDQNILVYNKRNNPKKTLPITTDIYDPTTAKIQLRLDLKKGKNDFSYNVMSKGKTKTYEYKILESELLMTPMGPLNAIKVQRMQKEKKNRDTIFWLARDWDYVLIKLSHREKNETYTLEIMSGSVSDEIITPINNS